MQSFLTKMRLSPHGDVQVPSFPSEGRTDRDGTAVIPPDEDDQAGEANQECKESGTDDDDHKSGNELQSRDNPRMGKVHSDFGKVDEIKDPSGEVYYTVISGSTGLNEERFTL